MKTVQIKVNNKTLCTALYCNTVLTRVRGLMFRKKMLPAVFVLPSETKLNAIVHTLFMFYKINIYWLDTKFNIVSSKLNVRPFTLSLVPEKKAKYIIELPTKYKLSGKVSISHITSN